jgi:hypothetical protein
MGHRSVNQLIPLSALFVWRRRHGPTVTLLQIPLIEPDMQIYRIRLSNKTSPSKVLSPSLNYGHMMAIIIA